MSKVLLLHPGQMGTSVGMNLIRDGHEVFWVSEGRSSATHERAQKVGLNLMDNLDAALEQVEMVISVCPPEFALDVGQELNSRNYSGLFCDANAIAPSTAETHVEVFGSNYVDGGIVGPPANAEGLARLYLSGPHAQKIADLFARTWFEPIVIDGKHTAASAMKMCYAAYTKGSAALILDVRALAEHYGVSGTLKNEWDTSIQGMWDRSHRIAVGTSRKAWRFAPEMREIAKTFSSAGLPSGFHTAAAEIYQRMAELKEVEGVSMDGVLKELLSKSDTSK